MDGSEIYDVTLGLGHNNDSGMAILTGLKEGLLRQKVKVIADGGYGAMYAITPTDKPDQPWRAEHAALRSVVERINSRTASFAASCINTGKFRGPPELQASAVMCIYHLVQHSLGTAPLYSNGSGPARWCWMHDYLQDSSTADLSVRADQLLREGPAREEQLLLDPPALPHDSRRTTAASDDALSPGEAAAQPGDDGDSDNDEMVLV